MAESIHAILLSREEFDLKGGESRPCDVSLRIQTPFVISKLAGDDEAKYEMDDDDVMIRGPVYVGNDEMLDRHNELVDPAAIMSAWSGYAKNPVILYNHSKEAGVIGKMVDVEMGEWDGIEGAVPIGRAIIDGGEIDIVRKIRKGLLKAFSIGFIAKAAIKEDDEEGETYITFTEIDWLETCVVDVPASPNALFNVEKHIIGYEDMGDQIAILFEKEPSDLPVDDEDEDEVVEDQVDIDADTPDLTPMEMFFGGLNARLDAIEEHLKSQSSESVVNHTVNTPLAESDGQPTEMNEMSEQEVIEATTEDEDMIVPTDEEVANDTAEAVEVMDEVQIKAEDVVPEAEDEAEDEPEAEDLVEADEPDAEVVELAVEADEEESTNLSTTEVLFEVVKALAGFDNRLSTIEGHIAVDDEVEALKAIIAEKDAEIDSLTVKNAEAEVEAELEAEVSKRVAERLADVGVEANPKSLSASNTPAKKETLITRHDPVPEVSKGMNGLANWLSAQIANGGD